MGLVERHTAATNATAFRQIKALFSAAAIQSTKSTYWLHLSPIAKAFVPRGRSTKGRQSRQPGISR
jgi:hypothetical protein